MDPDSAAPLSPAVAADLQELQKLQVATLQRAQSMLGSFPPAGRASCEEAIAMMQLALAALSRQTDPDDVRGVLEPARFRAFAELLHARRKAAGLSRQALAKRAGLSPFTIRNIERANQSPSRTTLCRLLAVAELGLQVRDIAEDVAADPAWTLNAWFAPRYNPSQLMSDMVHLLNGPGGQLEQTCLYLEPQSANDYIALCSSAPVFVRHRNQAPLEQIAKQIAKRFAGLGVDVLGLGSGDGRAEVRLTEALAALRPGPPDLRVYLLDISHTLLSIAHQHAAATLLGPGIDIYALHANFHDLVRYPILHASRAGHRRRLYTMLGSTIANLDNEVRFFKDLADVAATDDLLVLDIQLAYAPAERPEEIRRLEPPLAADYAPLHQKWLLGPIERHCHGLATASLRVDLTTHCPVPGSYELNFIGHAKMRDGIERRFMLLRVKRYDPDRLADCLSPLGWETLATMKYGTEAAKTAAVMLLRRK